MSTTHQDLERQLDALGKHGIPAGRIYTDKKTGATINRHGFTELLRYARSGDTIVSTNLDRMGRNLRECLNVVHDLREQGIGIKTLKDPIPIDTTDNSPMAELAVRCWRCSHTWNGCSCANAPRTPARSPGPRASCLAVRASWTPTNSRRPGQR